MTGYSKKPFKFAAKPFSLRGLVKCTCGCTVTPETHKDHTYYSCTNHKKIHTKRIYVQEKDLLAPLYETIAQFKKLTPERIDEITNELKENHENKNHFHSQAIKAMRDEYDAIETKIIDLRIID